MSCANRKQLGPSVLTYMLLERVPRQVSAITMASWPRPDYVPSTLHRRLSAACLSPLHILSMRLAGAGDAVVHGGAEEQPQGAPPGQDRPSGRRHLQATAGGALAANPCASAQPGQGTIGGRVDKACMVQATCTDGVTVMHSHLHSIHLCKATSQFLQLDFPSRPHVISVLQLV